MRSKFKVLIIFIVIFMSMFISTNVIEAFPSTLGSINQNGKVFRPDFGGGRGTHIKFSPTVNTYAFCTHYQDNSPARTGIKCYLNDNWSDRIRAGVAAIIVDSRNYISSVDQANNNYAAAEFAINKFLYYYNGYDGTHIVNETAFNSSSVNYYYNKAVNAYNNYQAYINFSTSNLSFSKEGNNYVSNWISVSTNAYWSISTSRGRLEKSGSSYRVVIDASSLSAGSTYSVTVSVSGHKSSDIARNYTCGSSHQSLTPNITESVTTYANESISGSFTVPNPPGNLRVKIVDSETDSLVGPSTVYLYKGSGCSNYYKTLYIGSSGSYTEYSLTPGYYSVKQVSAPSGYDLNSSCLSRYVYSDSTAERIIYNDKSKGYLRVEKIDKKTGNRITNSSATFYLYTNSSCTSYYTSFSITGVGTKTLPIGTYYLKEMVAPSNYNKDPNCYYVNITNKNTTEKVIQDEMKQGILNLKKIDNNNNEISGLPTKFRIYEGNSCNSSNSQEYTIYGSKSITLSIGNYAIKETQAPNGYIQNESCKQFTIEENVKTPVTFTNDKDCELKLGEKTVAQQQDPLERIELYKYYKEKGITYNNLLNFKINYDENFVKNSCSNSTIDHSLDIGCVSAKSTIKIDNDIDKFDSKNLSAYNETMTINSNGKDYNGYCYISFELLSNLSGNNSINNTYSYTDKHSFGTNLKSGQMVLSRKDTSKIAKGKVNKTCYFYGVGTNTQFTIQNSDSAMKNYTDYITSIELIAKNEEAKHVNVISEEIETDASSWIVGTDEGGTSDKYLKLTKEMTATYNLKDIYAVNGSGKTSYTDCSNCNKLGYGFVSAFTEEGSFSVPFKVNVNPNLHLNKSIYQSTPDKCTYTVNREIIEITPNVPNSQKLNIEFRAINTENPFPGKSGNNQRLVGANWCDKGNCTSDNNKVTEVIKKNNNSYNKNNKKAKYTITLTPDTIMDIRSKYSGNYDDYNLDCKTGVCKSKFLTEYSNIIKRA